MGLFDAAKDAAAKGKDLAREHSDQVQDGIEKAGDLVDDKTGGKYADKVDKAQEFASDRAEKL